MPAVEDEALQFSHSGQRYLLGYGRDFFGLWDRQSPGPPVERFPRTDEGWRAAWLAFVAKEPFYSEVAIGPATQSAVPAGPPTQRRVSGAWWLLPILLGWLGGLIAWLLVREANPRAARAMLLVGIAESALLYVLLRASGVPVP